MSSRLIDGSLARRFRAIARVLRVAAKHVDELADLSDRFDRDLLVASREEGRVASRPPSPDVS